MHFHLHNPFCLLFTMSDTAINFFELYKIAINNILFYSFSLQLTNKTLHIGQLSTSKSLMFPEHLEGSYKNYCHDMKHNVDISLMFDNVFHNVI